MDSYPLDLANVIHRKLGELKLMQPSVQTLTDLFEVLYFTSLKTEEGAPLHCRVVYLDPANPDPSPPPRILAHRWKHITLAERLPFNIRNLSKLCRGVDPWSSSLAVFADEDGALYIWGFIDQTVHFNTFIVRESGGGPPEPGLFQAVSQGVADIIVYREHSIIARLAQNALLQQPNDVLWTGPVSRRLSRYIASFRNRVVSLVGRKGYQQFPFWDISLRENWLDTICRILINVQRYRHGGALLITGTPEDLNVKYRIEYKRLSEALTQLARLQILNRNTWDLVHERYIDRGRKTMPVDLHLDEVIVEHDIDDSQMELTGCIRFISSLSLVDGLVLMRPDLTITGFGTEITCQKKLGKVFLATEPSGKKSSRREIDPNHFGTRHRSMMRYCQLHPASIGFVISQDGDIRAVTCEKEDVVLWDNIKVHRLFEQKALKSKRTKSN